MNKATIGLYRWNYSKPTKAQVLERYEHLEPRAFYLYDEAMGGLDYRDISAYPMDDDGDSLLVSGEYEMAPAPDVRLMVAAGTSAADTLRALRKIVAHLEEHGHDWPQLQLEETCSTCGANLANGEAHLFLCAQAQACGEPQQQDNDWQPGRDEIPF